MAEIEIAKTEIRNAKEHILKWIAITKRDIQVKRLNLEDVSRREHCYSKKEVILYAYNVVLFIWCLHLLLEFIIEVFQRAHNRTLRITISFI